MAKQILNPGASPNDGTGDSLRVGALKLNDNFNEIYNIFGDGDNLLVSDVDFGSNSIFFNNTVSTLAQLNNINPNTYSGLIMLVSSEGSLYFANSGSWKKLLADNSGNDVANYDDSLANVAYSGEYNDLRNRPVIPTSITNLGIEDGSAGQVLTTDGTGTFTFRDVEATSVDFTVIFNKPTTLEGYGITNSFSGSFIDLSDVPTLFSGSYADLTNKPTIPSDVSQLTDNNNTLFNGSYLSLSDKPTIPLDINQLTDVDDLLSASAFSGSYNDLTDKPTSFAGLSSISMNVGNAIDEFSNDSTLAGASVSSLPTEFAVKTYVDTAIAGFSEIANFVLSTDTSGVNDVGVITTSDVGGVRIDNATEVTGKLSLTATGVALDVTNNVSIAGNLTLWNNLINNLTLPNATDTVAVLGDISTAVADYLPLAGGTVTGNLTVAGDLNTAGLNLTGTGTYTFTSSTNVELDAANQVILKNSTNNIFIVDSAGADITGDLDVTGDVTANSITFAAGVSVNEFSNDSTLTDNSSTAVPTEAAVKGYVDTALSGGLSLTSLGLSTGVTISEFSNDSSLTDNSSTAVPTEAAVKGYVDSAISGIAAGSSIIQGDSAVTVTDTGTDGNIEFKTENVVRWNITSAGHLLPETNDAFDIGSAEQKVRDFYLSNNSLKFVDATDPLNPIEYPLGVDTSYRLQFNSDIVKNTSSIVAVNAGAIDSSKTNHFVNNGDFYTLGDGSYVGQELKFWRASGSGTATITIANAIVTDALGSTAPASGYAWGLGDPSVGMYSCIWNGSGWILALRGVGD